MAKKKIYAVKAGRITGLFDSWEDCKASVSGYPGAVFKGFSTKEEASSYLQEESAGQGHPDPQTIIAYVDGSFDLQKKKYSFGCILIKPDGSIQKESGNGSNPQLLAIRNVAGEMMGAMRAVCWAQVNGYTALEIRYDYQGIENWVTDAWEARQDATKNYEEYMKQKQQLLSIRFQKVKAHSGNHLNEEADRLAKEALTEPLVTEFSPTDRQTCPEEEILLMDRASKAR